MDQIISEIEIPTVDADCKICGKQFSRVNVKTKKKSYIDYCSSCLVNTRRFRLKKKCVDYKGGACAHCGYNKTNRALVFHHVDPAEKDFQISGSHSKKWELIKAELDKCILLCCNCHAEEHERLSIDAMEQERRVTLLENLAPKPKYEDPQCDRKLCSKCSGPKSAYTDGTRCKKCLSTIQWPDPEKLAELLQLKPARIVAKELGVSDTGLGKHCRKHNIKKPGLGFWTKLKHGKT